MTCIVYQIQKNQKYGKYRQFMLWIVAYSIILGKDPDNYNTYTPQDQIGKSLNKEAGSLIKYYKTGQQGNGYKGYSIDFRDLNIDIYKVELWKLLREVLRLLNCDTKKLEHQIFPPVIEDDDDVRQFGIICTSRANKKNNIDNYKTINNIQSNESLDKYQLLVQFLSV